MTSRKFFSDLLRYADKNADAQRIIQAYEKGLLTYSEATRQVIDLYNKRISGANANIREWYISTYPDDEAGRDIDGSLTFEEVYHALNMHDDIYDTIGVGDSVIRERIFQELSYIYRVSYDDIYDKWIS